MEPIIGSPTLGEGDYIRSANMETFTTEVIEASASLPVLVDFWADWCEPCKQLTPLLENAVTAAGGAVRLVKINVDENQALAAQLRIQSLPTVMAFKDGKPVDGFTGMVPESQIKALIEKLVGAAVTSPIETRIEQGRIALAAGNLEAAEQLFSEAFMHGGEDNPAALGCLAKIMVMRGRLEKAREILSNLSVSLSAHDDVKAALAAIELAEQGQNAGDVNELSALVEKEPENQQARFDLALALSARGRLDDAADNLLDMIRLDREWNDGAARVHLLKLFEVSGPTDPFTLKSRRRLSSVLFS